MSQFVSTNLYPVTQLHTFKLSAAAKGLVYINELQDVHRLRGLKNGQDLIILGEGSNTVFLNDFEGVVAVNQLKGVEVNETDSDYLLEVASGENWHDFVSTCLTNGIWGFENLALIPGTVGAAPIQNIGAYGLEVEQFIDFVEFLDLSDLTTTQITAQQCEFGYRDSIFKHRLHQNAFITKVGFKVPKQWHAICQYKPLDELVDPTAKQIYDRVCEVRSAKLPNPNHIGNSGSFFKNPIVEAQLAEQLLNQYPSMPCYPQGDGRTKLAAGWLIEQAGFKGKTESGIGSHQSQALVLVNASGHATGDNLLSFVAAIMAQVWRQFGVHLEPEVRMISTYGEINIAEQR